jgi:hypothetical protein
MGASGSAQADKTAKDKWAEVDARRRESEERARKEKLFAIAGAVFVLLVIAVAVAIFGNHLAPTRMAP